MEKQIGQSLSLFTNGNKIKQEERKDFQGQKLKKNLKDNSIEGNQ